MRTMIRLLTGAVAGAAAAVAAGAGATPAGATDTCGAPQRVEYETPGFNTVLQVRLCVSHGMSPRGAYAHVAWTDGGDSAADGDRKFDQLDIHYALRQDGQVVARGVCELAVLVNTTESGAFTCSRVTDNTPSASGWNAGGFLAYNLDRDGAGLLHTDLRASPVVPA